MMPAWLRLRWLPGRRAAVALLWAAAVIAVAVVANLVGIRMLGSISQWDRWLQEQAVWFFAWRLALYAVSGWGWVWMRRRLCAREPDGNAHQRFLRAEIAAAMALVALECSLLLQAR
ncbi:hypothetical protein AVKW3434_21835 [Acidovorax sp. SUPP3434]|uniref:hypothetical protein n=1 Tax=Acidovorax sp. SUPP3434 TaxID=2920880 RepID=UPI0023DE26FA|nr:hypothetical protein [Acidovorax sp. SUPP3434]GKT02078.1 hypothetical protein AVKW3434_21835 [Acidovorax sp. SUPP3434]